jgi:hypothetical protein
MRRSLKAEVNPISDGLCPRLDPGLDQEELVKIIPLVVIALVLLFGGQAASAAGWTRITSPNGGNIDQVGLLRTGDDILHVAWHHRTGPNTEDLLHTAISAGGRVGATTPIAAGWSGIGNPALVTAPGGIRVFFGGIRTTNAGEPNQELNTAFSSGGGASWTLQIGSVVPIGAQAYGSPVSAAVLPDGTPLEAWAGTLGTWVHAGLSPATPNYDYQAPLGSYGYDTGIAADAAGRAVLAWYSNATGHLGVFAQSVAADGSPIGSPANMPGTGNMRVGMIGRTPIVARSGGGFFVAFATGYPALNRVRLWRVGGGSSVVARTNRTGNTTATLAADGNGRWVAWTNTVGSSPHVFARRSNRAASVFGAVVDAGRPRGAASIYRLDASATGTALDVFGNTSIGVSSTTATWYSRIRPGLTLLAAPTKLHPGKTSEVTFTVLDAGDRVAGARVTAGGKVGTTNAKGKVTLAIVGRNRSVAATVTAKGYVGARLSLRVLRK